MMLLGIGRFFLHFARRNWHAFIDNWQLIQRKQESPFGAAAQKETATKRPTERPTDGQNEAW